MEWGIVGEREGRMGREREGGGHFARVDRDRTTHKGGIPSKCEGLGKREGSPGKGEIIKEIRQGVCAMCSDIVNLVYTYRAIVCMWLIKELCLGYK